MPSALNNNQHCSWHNKNYSQPQNVVVNCEACTDFQVAPSWLPYDDTFFPGKEVNEGKQEESAQDVNRFDEFLTSDCSVLQLIQRVNTLAEMYYNLTSSSLNK